MTTTLAINSIDPTFSPFSYKSVSPQKAFMDALKRPQTTINAQNHSNNFLLERFHYMLSDKRNLIEFDADGEMIEKKFEEPNLINLNKPKKKPKYLQAGVKSASMKSIKNRPVTGLFPHKHKNCMSEMGFTPKSFIQSFKMPIFQKTFKVMSIKLMSPKSLNNRVSIFTPVHNKKSPRLLQFSINSDPGAEESKNNEETLNKILKTPSKQERIIQQTKLTNFEKFIMNPDQNRAVIYEFRKEKPNFHKKDTVENKSELILRMTKPKGPIFISRKSIPNLHAPKQYFYLKFMLFLGNTLHNLIQN